MERETLELDGLRLDCYRVRTLVIGSGCAGLNAIGWLRQLGETSCALMTEGLHLGTSVNTGSDKQTYYKLALCAGQPDSVDALAATLMSEGVNGDTALAEAACSAQCFFKLVQLGVPFPSNEYGEFVGYRTDHDPLRRASSAGPLTSQLMARQLLREARALGADILEGRTAFELLVDEGRVAGVLAYRAPERSLDLVICAHVILATGGPASVYHRVVYPASQHGMSGMALRAGARAANLHQWQYGLASTKFRWNVSGSYQQALPRYLSVDAAGVERAFLTEALSPSEAANRCFLKGYQWPFDVRKVKGSSLIDLLVYRECEVLGRRVFLDFRRNPEGVSEDLSELAPEALTYLKRSGALASTPIERLAQLNPPAIELYSSQGIDLYRTPLEVAVCAQHHNGGLAVDIHWQTSLTGLYAAGEVAGTFGAYRPGGSALNATQVGSLRASQHIAYESGAQPLSLSEAGRALAGQLRGALGGLGWREDPGAIAGMARREMSRVGAQLRDLNRLRALAERLKEWIEAGRQGEAPADDLLTRLRLRDQLYIQLATVDAMLLAAEAWGSTGAGLVLDPAGEALPGLPSLRARPHRAGGNRVVITQRMGGAFGSHTEDARPLPQGDDWFERVWRDFRARTERA